MSGGRMAGESKAEVSPSLTNELQMHTLACTVNWNPESTAWLHSEASTGSTIAQSREPWVFRVQAWPYVLIFTGEQSLTIALLSVRTCDRCLPWKLYENPHTFCEISPTWWMEEIRQGLM